MKNFIVAVICSLVCSIVIVFGHQKLVVEPLIKGIVETNNLLIEHMEEQQRVMDIMVAHIGGNMEKIDDLYDIVDTSKQPQENEVEKQEESSWIKKLF